MKHFGFTHYSIIYFIIITTFIKLSYILSIYLIIALFIKLENVDQKHFNGFGI